MAVKIVQTILKQNTDVGSLEQVDMLFDFIHPLVYDAEDGDEDDSDDEVRRLSSAGSNIVNAVWGANACILQNVSVLKAYTRQSASAHSASLSCALHILEYHRLQRKW